MRFLPVCTSDWDKGTGKRETQKYCITSGLPSPHFLCLHYHCIYCLTFLSSQGILCVLLMRMQVFAEICVAQKGFMLSLAIRQDSNRICPSTFFKISSIRNLGHLLAQVKVLSLDLDFQARTVETAFSVRTGDLHRENSANSTLVCAEAKF